MFGNGDEDNYPLYFANNYIENKNHNPNDISRNQSVNFKYVYNSLCTLYSHNSQYEELINENPTQDFSNFNRLKIILALNNNSEYIYIHTINAYNLFNKILSESDVTRNFVFDCIDNNGNSHISKFTINTDGTFNFTSDGNVALISVNGYNELFI